EQTLRKDFGLDKHMRRGFRALFHGPSGTGKSLTAALIGKQLRQPVYRVDLSRLVSKYVGETSKNLERLFKKAEGKKWILFFDEGDVLLNKRTGNSAGDSGHYANQEVAYLLQRIEDYDGLVIVATNLRGNLDVAFARRFESFIHFSTPEESVALLLWEKNWPAAVRKGASIDLAEFAGRYPVSAATIVNILKKMSLRLLMNKQRSIELPELEEIADREIRK
ncbi:MAG: ATP-binding protein, partial [Cytophagales bacterium]|nr:ATP-binding protein [Cytophagales bacterium]